MTFTLTKQSGGGYTIVNGTNYIGLPSSNSASLSLGTTNKTEWTVSQGVNGTFRFTNPGYTSRGLVYRAGTTNAFSGYALSNATSSSTEYFDIELFKYVEQAASSFDLVNDFVGNYMHMNDVSIGNESDTGACKGESGYYLTAKKAWNAMVNDYEGEDNLQTVFQNSFEDAYARYNAWAVACNDAAPFDGNDTVVSPIRSSAIIMSINNDTSSVVTIIIMVSLVSLTAIGGYFFIRKRKEQ